MSTLAIYCKSYQNDVRRVIRLAESVRDYNVDQIPIYVSVPAADRALFQRELEPFDAELLDDEEILALDPGRDRLAALGLDGGMTQQVVKSQFWRLGLAENYVVIDSDSYFIRDFHSTDFMATPDVPFTVMHEGRDLLQWAVRSGNDKILGYFEKDRRLTMAQFGREGLVYDFGPTPCVWSAKVWRDLMEQHAEPQGKTFADLIVECPNEMLWYGETLLHFNSIPLFPREPLFKVFHYKDQFDEAVRVGENESVWAKNYMGVVAQSNWEFDMDTVKRKKRSWKTLWLLKV